MPACSAKGSLGAYKENSQNEAWSEISFGSLDTAESAEVIEWAQLVYCAQTVIGSKVFQIISIVYARKEIACCLR